MNEKIERFKMIHSAPKALHWPSFSLACSMSSRGSDGNMAVIHLCFPLLGRHTKRAIRAQCARAPSSDCCLSCNSLSVRLEQDLVFELLAFTQLQVEDEAWDALQLLTEVLHFQLSYLGMDKHHELPRTAKKMSYYYQDHQQTVATIMTFHQIFRHTTVPVKSLDILHYDLFSWTFSTYCTMSFFWWKCSTYYTWVFFKKCFDILYYDFLFIKYFDILYYDFFHEIFDILYSDFFMKMFNFQLCIGWDCCTDSMDITLSACIILSLNLH